MAKLFLGLILISAAVQLSWAMVAEGHLLALPLTAVMLYAAWRNLKGFIWSMQIGRAADGRLQGGSPCL